MRAIKDTASMADELDAIAAIELEQVCDKKEMGLCSKDDVKVIEHQRAMQLVVYHIKELEG